MKKSMKNLTCLLILCYAAGCKIPDNGPLDTSAPPFITQASTSPSQIDVTHLGTQPSSPIDTTIFLTASVDTVATNVVVTYTLLNPDGSVLLSGGLSGSDGKFSASIPFQILKQDVGIYGVQFQAVAANDAENKSNILAQSLVVKNTDHNPIISDLVMADTVYVPPPGDTVFVKITVAAADADGLQDILSVALTSRRPDGSVVGVYPMYDDGGVALVSPFGLKSGDAVRGDGIYTLTIPLTSSTTGNTFRDFSFMATDRSGGTSNVLTQRIFIQ